MAGYQTTNFDCADAEIGDLALSVIGLVAIGRNEGQRLRACLGSALAVLPREQIVYVDSNSSDDSLEIAGKFGVAIVKLDDVSPLTAARARNAGFAELLARCPKLELVQFIDGDCELASGWLDVAARSLDQHPEVAVVCGRVRERFPERSTYNWLCDQEWDAPIGETLACGGNAMFRVKPFEQVGGFRSELIAGEEPELCLRLREQDWKVRRLDAPMTVHDAAMTSFSQWWRRASRGGYAYAEISSLHASSPARIWQREKMRTIAWGGILPLAIVGGAFLSPLAFAALLLYPAQVCRIALQRGITRTTAWKFATFMMLAKFAEMQGVAGYWWSRAGGNTPTSIDYRDVDKRLTAKSGTACPKSPS